MAIPSAKIGRPAHRLQPDWDTLKSGEKKVVITALDPARTVPVVISVSQSARSQERQFALSFTLALYPPRRTSLGAGLRLGGDR
jgi:hypothetical protein